MATILQFRRQDYGPTYAVEQHRPDRYQQLATAEAMQRVAADERRDLKAIRRHLRWQLFMLALPVRVKWFAILTAYATLIYFAWQIGRGL